MRLQVTIPHFYRHGSYRRYGSGSQPFKQRLQRLRRTILLLHQNFGQGCWELNIASKRGVPVDTPNQVDVVLCTHVDDHLLPRLQLSTDLYRQIRVSVEDPKLLGFGCHQMLRKSEGYDRYLFMEDDLVFNDTDTFHKLDELEAHFGSGLLFQPNRYERTAAPPFLKCNVDGPLRPEATFSHLDGQKPISLERPGRTLHFEPALNPHSGTFCLSRTQWEHWRQQPATIDTSFVGPLESAATLSILKAFDVYKPSGAHRHHLEVEHQGNAFISQLHQGTIPSATS